MDVKNCLFQMDELVPPNSSIRIAGGCDSPLYRVMALRHAKTWIESGELRISPLSRYREVSLTSRCDPREGEVSHVGLGNNEFRFTARPLLSLSLTRYPLSHLVKKFRGDEPEDYVVVKIDNPAEWVKALDSVVRAECAGRWPIDASVINAVAYSDVPNLDFGPQGARLPPPLLKPVSAVINGTNNRYWIEAEVRAIWQPATNTPGDYVFARSSQLTDACRIMSETELLGDDHIERIQFRTYSAADHAEWLKTNPLSIERQFLGGLHG